MNIGRLNKRISLFAYDEADGEYGILQEKKPLMTVWATVEPVTGKEETEGKKTRDEVTYKIYIRYNKAVTEAMLVRYKDKTLQINSLINVKEENKMLLLDCTEKIRKVEKEDTYWEI